MMMMMISRDELHKYRDKYIFFIFKWNKTVLIAAIGINLCNGTSASEVIIKLDDEVDKLDERELNDPILMLILLNN